MKYIYIYLLIIYIYLIHIYCDKFKTLKTYRSNNYILCFKQCGTYYIKIGFMF